MCFLHLGSPLKNLSILSINKCGENKYHMPKTTSETDFTTFMNLQEPRNPVTSPLDKRTNRYPQPIHPGKGFEITFQSPQPPGTLSLCGKPPLL